MGLGPSVGHSSEVSTRAEQRSERSSRCSLCGQVVDPLELEAHRLRHFMEDPFHTNSPSRHGVSSGAGLGGIGFQLNWRSGEMPRFDILGGHSLNGPMGQHAGFSSALDLINFIVDEIGNPSHDFALFDHSTQSSQSTPSEMLHRLPTMKFKHGDKQFQHDESCLVCLEKYVDADELRRLPCFHLFHSACIDEWLSRSIFCPVCKIAVDGSDQHQI